MYKKFISFVGFNRRVFTEYFADNLLKYSASLAYYTTLSLAPLLVILISVSGFLFGKEAMRGEVYGQISGLVGKEAALQIQTTIQNVHLNHNTPFATIISLAVLLIGATGIFAEIQDSLNKIWGLKTKTRKVWWKLLTDRLISFSLILSLGFVLMVSLILNAFVAAVSVRLNALIMGAGDTMLPLIDLLLSAAITMLIFAAIFKVLPDAKIKWKDVLVGALVTAVLFTLGKFAIGFYLGKSSLASIYGAAGSVIIIMIWIYYSSAILFLGAVFTKIYAMEYGGKIYPNEYAVWIETKEIPVANVKLNENT
ncbi:N/A [soil metagenome]